MIHEYQLRVLPETAANEQRLKTYIAEEKGLDAKRMNAVRILRRSIDARQRTIYVNLSVRVYVDEVPDEDGFRHTLYNNVEGRPPVVVVGAGPGGLFAALRLIELGLRPVVVERGKDVHARKKDLAQISRTQTVDPESNYSFGERRHPSWWMPTRTLVRTSCRVLSRTCGTPSCNVAARCTSRPAWMPCWWRVTKYAASRRIRARLSGDR